MRREVFTAHIAQTPDVIWAFLADLRNDKKWRHEIAEVELVAGQPGTAPATYREVVKWESASAEITLTVSEAVCCSHLLILSDGPGYQSASRWSFDPSGDGTIVTLAFSFKTFGAVHLTEQLLWAVVTGWLSRDLPLLEGHLLAAAPGQPQPAGTSTGATWP